MLFLSRMLGLASVIFLAACSHDTPSQQPTPPTTPTATASAPAPAAADSAPVAAPTASAAAPAKLPAAGSVYQQLQGRWQSTADEKDVIEIKGHNYIDYYDNELLSTKTFLLDQACPGEKAAGKPGDNARYLVLPADDMCWLITGIDGVSLELEYVAGGKILVYRKMK